MKSLSVDTHAHDPVQDEELFKLLTKEGQDPGESPGDDNESTVGVNPPQTEEPTAEERGKGSIDASWGESAGDHKGDHALHFSNEVVRQFRENREKMLDTLFDSKGPSEDAEQQLAGQHLRHVAEGDFESSAPMIKEKSKIQKTAGVQTLMERVRSLTGRH